MSASLAAGALRTVERVLAKGKDTFADAERVCRFLTGRLEFEPRPSDIYVATYPRSGTTWMQFILYLLTSDRSMAFEHLSQVSPWFERSLALGTRRATDFESLPEPRVFKTHLTPEWLPSIGRAIYVERDGLDVALSYYHLYRSHLGYRGTLDEFFDRFMQGDLQYRSWFDHTERWRAHAQQHPDEVMCLRYERMVEDLSDVVARAARFIGRPTADAERAEVAAMASFDFMRAHHNRFDPITEARLDKGQIHDAFIRRGQRGDGRDNFSEGQCERFRCADEARGRSRSRQWRIHDFLL